MVKVRKTEEYDPTTGEVVDVETPQVSYEEVQAQLEQLKAGDHRKVFEWPDPRPVAPPIGYVPEMSLAERIRAMVRSEHLRYAAMQGGMETFEEADDFDVDDDFDPSSPYEMFFDPPVVSAEAHPSGVSSPLDEPGRGGGGAEPPSGKPNSDPVGGAKGGSQSDPPVTKA